MREKEGGYISELKREWRRVYVTVENGNNHSQAIKKHMKTKHIGVTYHGQCFKSTHMVRVCNVYFIMVV